jgi:nucleoside-diphosphate-sugar epimerase
MAKLLVIGGTGFFGKSILDAFYSNALEPWGINEITLLARQAENLYKKYPKIINNKIRLLNGDISVINELPFADFIIHAAASSDSRNYLAAPLKERANIIGGTLNYCVLAKKFHKKSKIIYVSSGAVYGTQPNNLNKIDENFLFQDITHIAENKKDYTIAKQDSEKAILSLGRQGLNVSIARCFAFVGQWLPLDQHFAIGNFIRDGLQKQNIRIHASHRVYRSYMYADDLVEWLMTIANQSSILCPIYNVGSDRAILLDELANKVGMYFGQKVNQQNYLDDFVDRYIPNVDKAKNELDLKIKFNLENAIRKTIQLIEYRNLISKNKKNFLL